MADDSTDIVTSSANASARSLATANERSSSRNEMTTSQASSSPPTRVTTQEIVLTKCTGLGIAISGGIDRPGEGAITVADIITGGDCHKDGRLHVGDTLLSINADSLESVTHEAAIGILTKVTLNPEIRSIVLRYRPSLATGNLGNLGQPRNHTSDTTLAARQASTLPATGVPHMVQNSSRSMPHLKKGSGYAGPGMRDQREMDPAVRSISDQMEPPQEAAHINTRAAEIQRSLPRHGTAVPAFLSQSYPSLTPVRPHRPFPHQTRLDVSSIQAPTRPAYEGPFSIESEEKFKVERLHVALGYLGLHLNEEQKQKLKNQLRVDASGMVHYGEFVSAAKQLFRLSLNETSLDTLPPSSHVSLPGVLSQMSPGNMSAMIPVADFQLLKQERDTAVQEARKYLGILQDNERTFSRAEEELLRVRRDAQAALHESRALKSRVHLAEAAHKEARSMEMDYEDVVRMLETEVGQLRDLLKERAHVDKSKSERPESLRQRLATLDGELRKSETARKTFEVATGRLLKFAELVYDTETGTLNGQQPSNVDRAANGINRSSGHLGRHQKRRPVNLATEAKEVVKAVKALIDVEALPYGWEETYTKDGSRFFTNHVTQSTSWVHPVSNISHSTAAIDELHDPPETDIT